VVDAPARAQDDGVAVTGAQQLHGSVPGDGGMAMRRCGLG